MSVITNMKRFFSILTECFTMRVPDAYETEKSRAGEIRYKIPGNIVGGQYGG